MKDEKMTPIEYLKQYLGVVDGELFDVYVDGDIYIYSPYYFKRNNIYDKNNCDVSYCAITHRLLTGKCTIKKRPFVPKEGEAYYYFGAGDMIYSRENDNYSYDIAMIKCGWAFRTRAEAEANKERVMREMKEVMKND